MQRVDPLKVFIGSLSPGVNKPMLVTLFDQLQLQPVDIIVPETMPGFLTFAFVTFLSAEESNYAIGLLNGYIDASLSPSCIKALRGVHHGILAELSLDWVEVSWTLGSF